MIETRLMRAEDVNAVWEIDRATFADFWARKAIEREVTENGMARWMVLTEDDQVVAYTGAWFVFGEAQIMKVAVREDKRRNGYGERVLRALIQLAADSEMQEVTLEVRAQNTAAQSLYKKLGFVRVGLRPHYYEDGEDAVLMTLSELPIGNIENDPFLVRED